VMGLSMRWINGRLYLKRRRWCRRKARHWVGGGLVSGHTRGGYGLMGGLLLGQQAVQGWAADPYAFGDLGFGDSRRESVGRSGGNLLHRRGFFATGALQDLAERVESATGFDVGCVGHLESVKHLSQNVNCVTLRSSTETRLAERQLPAALVKGVSP
jgi:hypothetical protein